MELFMFPGNVSNENIIKEMEKRYSAGRFEPTKEQLEKLEDYLIEMGSHFPQDNNPYAVGFYNLTEAEKDSFSEYGDIPLCRVELSEDWNDGWLMPNGEWEWF